MNFFGLIRSAVRNSLRSKTRTSLTVIAIFIGAFTLALTTAVGTGINAYIDTTVASIGAADVMTVTKPNEGTETSPGPQVYDADETVIAGEGPQGPTIALVPADISAIADVPGVRSVEPTFSVAADYVVYDGGTPYQVTIGSFVPGMALDLASGVEPDHSSSSYEVALPISYIEPLGFADADAAVGETVSIGITDADGTSSTVDAVVSGVAEEGLVSGSSLTPNDALTTQLHSLQIVGLSESARESYGSATVRFDPASTDAEIEALKGELDSIGFSGSTVSDQIGAFRTVIDAIVLVLNGFAAIALLAAGFGIVNTLLMSVQERTREIGLMKAMGMGAGKVFSLFSLEAVFIGFLGSAIGIGGAMLAGLGVNGLLAGGLLADLPGLTLIVFDPMSVLIIVLVVMGIAFLAGTIPALRAARKDPIEALRYE